MKFLKEILSLLAENKNFPAYQAERRIDIFLNIFLEDILKLHDKDAEYKFIAPEFPLKIDESYQSTNADYLCLKEKMDGSKEILLIELKTDSKSFNKGQLDIYLKFEHWSDCLEGLLEIIKHGKMSFDDRLKYYHLVKTLNENHLIKLRDKLPSTQFSDGKPKRKEQLNFTQAFRNALPEHFDDESYRVKVIYIAPENMRNSVEDEGKASLISFEDIRTNTIPTKYTEEWKLVKENLLQNL
jgi:hypothetical protein